MKRLLVVLACLLAGSPAAASADTYPRQPNVDVSHYRFALTLGDDTDDIRGEATVDVRLVTAGIRDVDLDLVQPSAGRSGRGMTVSAVTASGTPCPYLHRNDRLRISLPSPSAAGQLVRITVVYHGIPATGLIIGPNKHGDRTFFSDNWPDKAHQWLPVIDHISDKATCEFSVDAPAHYQVISNGLKIEETDLPGGRRRTVWRQSVPISTWLYALGVAPFAVQRVGEYAHVPIETWVYAQDRDAGFYDFAVPARDVMAFFSTWIGPFAYEKLANVQANSVHGGMESASNIFYGADSVTGTRTKRWRNVIIHEIAHQWFGNAVTERDWDDVWLSEGFATYFTLLYVEHAYGRDEFVEGLRSSRKTVLDFDAGHPDYRVVHDNLSDMKDVTTPQTYQKGAWTLHMLRGLMGDDRFWAGIRGYYRRYRDAVASTADFRHAMEEAAGSDLGWFFDQWLYRGGLPRIEGGWHYDAAARRIEIELNQRQPGPAFRMPIDIAIMTTGVEPRTERVQITGRTGAFSIPSDQPPASVVIDPDVWTLMDVAFTKR
jgi:aminopeptidase N